MGEQQRVEPDLIEEVNEYNGSSFSDRLRNWAQDQNRLEPEDVRIIVREEVEEALQDMTETVEPGPNEFF